MDNFVTCDLIIDWLKEQYEKKNPVSPHTFIESAEKLNILMSDEHAKLFELQQKVAQGKVDLLTQEKKPSVAEVKLISEASDLYKEMCIQKAKIGRIEEHIRLAKIHSRMSADEARGYH